MLENMSVSINVDVTGAEEFGAAISRFDSEMQSKVQQQLADWAQSVKAQAERLVPVKTGYLRSSITVKAEGWQLEIGAEAAYAAAVEFGTRNQRAEPFIAPAIEANLPALEQVMLEAVDLAKSEAEL
jgi:HK97 gp10 family phage protein